MGRIQNLISLAQDSEEHQGGGVWYLGLDVGTTRVSAALLNSLTCELYPIYWIPNGDSPYKEPMFELSSAVYLSSQELLLQDFKPWLICSIAGTQEESDSQGRGIPSRTPIPEWLKRPTFDKDKRMVQWSEERSLPLSSLLQGLQALLATLKPPLGGEDRNAQWMVQNSPDLNPDHPVPLEQQVQHPVAVPLDSRRQNEHRSLDSLWRGDRMVQGSESTLNSLGLLKEEASNPCRVRPICGAAGLEGETFAAAMSQLSGAIVSQPANWPDSYRFNLREAVIGAKLVEDPSQIVFLEDTIAVWLSVLPGSKGERVTIPTTLSTRVNPYKYDGPGLADDYSGGTRCALAIDAGATTTELALVTMPDQLRDLTHSHFKLLSIPYAGHAIDQDIICQLFWNPDVRRENSGYWFLGCDLQLPRPGQPDIARRTRLQQRLLASTEGKVLLETAECLKLNLQERDRVKIELGGHQWAIARRELDKLVFEPFIQYLNQQLNRLLIETGIAVVAIKQAVCTGGTAQYGAIAGWLRQKLPNATMIQDMYVRDRRSLMSRVAYGLATLPLNPQAIDLHRQQYSDYFLLAELLRTIPNRPLCFAEIIQLLERGGINTCCSQNRIQALLDGHLPPGLMPSEDALSLTLHLSDRPHEQLANGSSLFDKEDNNTYRLNPQQYHRLRKHLNALTRNTYQKLEEPLTFTLERGSRYEWRSSMAVLS